MSDDRMTRFEAAAVRGEMPVRALTTEERLVANVELDVAIRERAATASFGRALLREGVTVVALDDNGVLVELRPDGAGKSTFAARILAERLPGSPFVDAEPSTS